LQELATDAQCNILLLGPAAGYGDWVVNIVHTLLLPTSKLLLPS